MIASVRWVIVLAALITLGCDEVPQQQAASKTTKAPPPPVPTAGSDGGLTAEQRAELAAAAKGRSAELAAEGFEEWDSVEGRLKALRMQFENTTAGRIFRVRSRIDLSGITLVGHDLDWDAYRGKVVIVVFCDPEMKLCAAYVPELNRLAAEHAQHGLAVLGVTVEEDIQYAKTRQFLDDHQLDWTMLAAPRNSPTLHDNGVSKLPVILLVDRLGYVAGRTMDPAVIEPVLNQLVSENYELAEVGVGSKGRDYKSGYLGEVVGARFRAEEKIRFAQAQQALQMHVAQRGRPPQSNEQFMKEVLRANNIPLPQLPPGDSYFYDAREQQLMVRHKR